MLDPVTRESLGAAKIAQLSEAVGLAAHQAFLLAVLIAAGTLLAASLLPARLSPVRTPP
jgi:hypothetical protein